MIKGLNHITFAVKNLEKSFEFYKDILGLTPVAKWKNGAYFTAGGTWIALNKTQPSTESVNLPQHAKEIIEYLRKEIHTLRGIIPICSSCKKVRDDNGYWQQVEAYVRDRSEAEFSHSIYPECLEKLYPEFAGKK
jgi:hypothetical protein